MKLLVVESLCGGKHAGHDIAPSLLEEGAVMLSALLADLVRIYGLKVTTLVDHRATQSIPARKKLEIPDDVLACTIRTPADWQRTYAEQLAVADAAWIIAPEIDDELASLVGQAEAAGVRLVSPGSDFVALASNKTETCAVLAASEIRVPKGFSLPLDRNARQMLRYPAVLKLNDGAGSQDMRLLTGGDNLPDSDGWRVEEWCPGQPASVALATGSIGAIVLGTATQWMSHRSGIQYVGGRAPLPTGTRERAMQLASRALKAMPPATGYVGVDLILGEAEDGSQDVVLEINPRLTTSYVGHRETVDENLAELVLQVASGCDTVAPEPKRVVRFWAMGITLAKQIQPAIARARSQSASRPWVGLDIGGANLKLADTNGTAVELPFELWRYPERLAEEIAQLLQANELQSHIAVTMTGELADCYATKRDGVLAIADAVETAAPKARVSYYCVDGVFRNRADLTKHHALAAASNWHAAATFAARFLPDQTGLFIDIGSTTTDIISVFDGVPETSAVTDVDRMMSRELVYTGFTRTPVHAIARSLPLRGDWCPVAAEHFATTADVYNLLGFIPDGTSTATADGRPLDREHSLTRLARCVCGDIDMLSESELCAMARHIADRQHKLIRAAIHKVSDPIKLMQPVVILSGCGKPLGQIVCELAGLDRVMSLDSLIGERQAIVTPALAVATLAKESIE